ncbi:MAG TPA: UDP-N-acetylmuramoyl-tripeptide--D-alanyl-D-alanine ligase [Acidobacteriota bacterium]
MARLTLGQIAAATGGRILRGSAAASCAGFAIDSRQLRPGDLFFALVGPRYDGHDFAAAALRAGAGGVVVSRAVAAAGAPLALEVCDTTRALQELAGWLRRARRWKVIGITGSSGKTTTKELAAALLSERFRVAASPGNLNNLYGLPLALLQAPDDAECFVAELGMSTPGELTRLCAIARPDVGALLNVGLAHRQNFASLAEVAEAKGELVASLPRRGALAFNARDRWVVRLARRFRGRKLSFGLSPQAEVRATRVRWGAAGMECVLRLGKLLAEVRLPLLGRHQVENLLAAAALALLMGVAPESIAARAQRVEAAPHRGELRALAGGATALDDSYNANPSSMRAALAALRGLPGYRRRLAVLGDMLELGGQAQRAHRALGRALHAARLDHVIGVGTLMAEAVEAAAEAGMPKVRLRSCADAGAAVQALRALLRPGDLVLVKGSHAIGLERLVEALARPGRA